MNFWLSIIIPAYKCTGTIDRLLQSIIMQGDPNVEIIVCDDYQKDNLKEVLARYNDLLNIKYCTTNTDCHCPGNTRMEGWKYATGEWITFIDNDDILCPYSLYYVKKWIKERNETHLLTTQIKEWDYYGNKCLKELDAITWMHGKFYNRQWLIDEGINFKPNLEHNEDLYFNGLVFGSLAGVDIEYTKSNFFTYKWIYEPESLSRKEYHGEDNHTYAEKYFNDYILAATEPFFISYMKYPEKADVYFDKLCYSLLHAYFYYEGFYYKFKEKVLPDDLIPVKRLIKKICNVFDVTPIQIVQHVYFFHKDDEEDYYIKTRNVIENVLYPFVETHSFYDFAMMVAEV